MVTRRPAPVAAQPEALLADLRQLIDQARAQVAQAANSALTLLYWHVGQRIRREVLGEQRAGYGEQIVATLSHELTREYGKGFTRTALTRMVTFAEAFPDWSPSSRRTRARWSCTCAGSASTTARRARSRRWG